MSTQSAHPLMQQAGLGLAVCDGVSVWASPRCTALLCMCRGGSGPRPADLSEENDRLIKNKRDSMKGVKVETQGKVAHCRPASLKWFSTRVQLLQQKKHNGGFSLAQKHDGRNRHLHDSGARLKPCFTPCVKGCLTCVANRVRPCPRVRAGRRTCTRSSRN